MENLKLAAIIFGVLLLFIFSARSCSASPRVGVPVIEVEKKESAMPVVIATALGAVLINYHANTAMFTVRPNPKARPQIKKDAVMAVIEWQFD